MKDFFKLNPTSSVAGFCGFVESIREVVWWALRYKWTVWVLKDDALTGVGEWEIEQDFQCWRGNTSGFSFAIIFHSAVLELCLQNREKTRLWNCFKMRFSDLVQVAEELLLEKLRKWTDGMEM